MERNDYISFFTLRIQSVNSTRANGIGSAVKAGKDRKGTASASGGITGSTSEKSVNGSTAPPKGFH